MPDPEPLLTVSGPPASGTPTLAEALADDLGYDILSGGDVFRGMAADRDLSLAEFTRRAEADPAIDRELDDRLSDAIDDHLAGRRESSEAGLIVDARLAGWHADGRATLAVRLDAPLDVRAERIDDRDETPAELRERERSDRERYREYYGADVTDPSLYDLVLDTDALSIDGTSRIVRIGLEDVRGE